jgi:hypothetical protein
MPFGGFHLVDMQNNVAVVVVVAVQLSAQH